MLTTLAQSSNDGGSAGASVIFLFLPLALTVVVLAGYWKVFTKIGLPGGMDGDRALGERVHDLQGPRAA